MSFSSVVVKIKYGGSETWTVLNPILPNAEEGIERDTGRKKIGDGINRWRDLAYESYGILKYVPIEVEVVTTNAVPVEVFRFTIPSGRTARITYDCLAAGRSLSAFGGFRSVAYQAINDLLILLADDGDEGNNGPIQFNREVDGNDVVFFIVGVNEMIKWLLSFSVRFVDIPSIPAVDSNSGSGSSVSSGGSSGVGEGSESSPPPGESGGGGED